MNERYSNAWTVGEWTFYEMTDHPFSGDLAGKTLYTFKVTGKEIRRSGELYDTLEHAMATAIAEKYTGARGAGGTGVGTAADWFMKMIGAERPTRAELIEQAGKDATVIGLAEDSSVTRGDGRMAAQIVVDALGHLVHRP